VCELLAEMRSQTKGLIILKSPLGFVDRQTHRCSLKRYGPLPHVFPGGTAQNHVSGLRYYGQGVKYSSVKGVLVSALSKWRRNCKVELSGISGEALKTGAWKQESNMGVCMDLSSDSARFDLICASANARRWSNVGRR